MIKSVYENIVLNDEEIKEAIREAKIKKYFHEKHAAYWIEQEKKIIKDRHVTNL